MIQGWEGGDNIEAILLQSKEALEKSKQEQEKIQGYLDQLNGLTNNK